MIPSSDHSACVSMPCCSRSSARSASPQGACTRAPKGESTHRRQSPISSRKRSTTIVRSEGRTPVAQLLLAQVLDERARRALVAGVQSRQPLHGALVVERGELALQAADGAPELDRPAGLLALPERHLSRLAGRGGDDHAVALDLLDAPGRCAEQEDLPLARLVHHLLVELADAAAAVDQEDAVEAAVGDRPGVRDRDPLRALARAQGAGRALPDDARPQLGELVRGVAAREQVEHVLELLARELAVGVGARARARAARRSAAPRPRPSRRSAGTARRAGCAARACARRRPRACRGRPRRPRRARPGSAGRCARATARRPSGPARPTRCRPLATEPGDETCTTRSTAPMSMPSSSDDVATMHGSVPALSASSTSLRASRESEPWWARATGSSAQLVEAQRQPLGHAAAVHEHDRRVVRAHELEQLGVERRPQRVRAAVVGALRRRRPAPSARPRRSRPASRCARSSSLRMPASTMLHVAVAADEARDLLERPLRRRQRDALRIALAEGREPLEREREVRAALGRGDGVHLVDDHGLDAGEHLARARGEQQVEALGRRDQHVGRRAQHAPALVGAACRRCAPRRSARAARRRAAAARRADARRAARAGCARRRS